MIPIFTDPTITSIPIWDDKIIGLEPDEIMEVLVFVNRTYAERNFGSVDNVPDNFVVINDRK